MLFGGAVMFPESTLVGKKIPKQRFYDNVTLSASVKKKFIDQIDKIVFANKFSNDTLNIAKTDNIEEIFVFDISLKDNAYIDKIEGVLGVIDQSVPYPILYQFKLRDLFLYKIAYKKRNQNDLNKSVVDVYFTKKIHIDELDSFSKELDGIFNALDMEILYENLIKLFLHEQNGSFEESIEAEKNNIFMKNELIRLNRLIKKEKQADKQYEIHKKILEIKKELNKTGLKESGLIKQVDTS